MRGGTLSRLLLVVLAGGCAASGEAVETLDLSTAIEVTGNEFFTADEIHARIAEELEVPVDRAPTKAEVDDVAYSVEELYRESGFAFARVDYEYLDDPGSRVHARLEVQEGNRVMLAEVRLEGNESYSGDELQSFLEVPSTGTFSDERLYVERSVEAFQGALAGFYYRNGFLRSEVSPPEVTFDEGLSKARVLVRIHQGPRFVLRNVRFQGALALPLQAHEAVARQHVGEPYTPRLGVAVRAGILDLHGRKGYPDCRVDIAEERDEATGDVSLTLTVTPGPLVTIRKIEIEGNEHTRERLIRTRLGFEEGVTYDAETLREAFRRLYRSGLFLAVSMDLDDTSDSERTLFIRVQEAASLEFHVEPGWGSYEGPRLVAGVTERNVFGTGLELGFEGNVSLFDQGAHLSLTEPWLFQTDTSGTWSVFGKRRKEPSFLTNELGTGLSFTHRFSDILSGNLTYAFRATRLEDADLNDPTVQELLEDVDVSSISVSVQRNTANNPFGPSAGSRSSLSFEWASTGIGSQIDFVAGSASLSRYFGLTSRTVLAMTGRTSLIVPIADTTEIPLQLRLFNGGENSVRSFKEDELGPKDDVSDLGPGGMATNEPIGGRTSATASLELRQRLLGSLSGALFVDAGNVLLDEADYFDFRDLRYAVGCGLRYWLPVGPLRLDLGVNPDPQDGEDDYVIHFSIGMAF